MTQNSGRVVDPRPLLQIHGSAPLMLLRGTHRRAAEEMSGWREAGLEVRLLRGRKMRTVSRLFDEVSAALQFPYYFGGNWAAFEECLSDLEWVPSRAGAVAVVIDADEVLLDEPDAEMTVLVQALHQASATYAEPINLGEWWDRPALPFHVVLQAAADREDLVRRRWGASGAALSALS